MEYSFSVLMFIFSGAVLFYALLIGWTKDIKLIPRHYSARIKNKRRYAVQFSKLLAVAAFSPAVSGFAGLFTENVFLIMGVLVAGFIVCFKIGRPFMKDL